MGSLSWIGCSAHWRGGLLSETEHGAYWRWGPYHGLGAVLIGEGALIRDWTWHLLERACLSGTGCSFLFQHKSNVVNTTSNDIY